MCDNAGRKNPTMPTTGIEGDHEPCQQRLDTSSVGSNIPEQTYVEDSRETTGSIEPHSSDDGYQGTQSCKNEVEIHTNPPLKKTPMRLISELARYHKLQPTYQLVQETGPAHQKTFVVNLKLGDNEYTASGQRIKEAKHDAAQLALQSSPFNLQSEPESRLKHPSGSQTDQIFTSPTVELKALAMKLNLLLVYSNLSPVPAHIAGNRPDSSSNSSAVTVNRNDFASERGRNLDIDLKMPFLSTNSTRLPTSTQNVFYSRLPPALAVTHRVSLTVGKISVIGEGPIPRAARHAAARLALKELRKEKMMEDKASKEADVVSETGNISALKSPVSIAHELALKLNQTVEFTMLSESGPPHMRNYLAQYKIGEIVTQGEGHSKKLAKKKAAEAMLIEINKAHSNDVAFSEIHLNNPISPRQRSKAVTQKKEESSTLNSGRTSLQNPVSQLIQLQQFRKEKEPIFTLVSESGKSRSPEFVFKVTVGTFEAIGIGTKKKDAKRAAALKVLQTFGIVNEAVPIAAHFNQEDGNVVPSAELPSHSVNFINGRQPLLFEKKKCVTNYSYPSNNHTATASSQVPQKFQSEMRRTHLAGYEIEFSDFPKSKTGEFVSIVTVDSTPPQICHGLGCTPEEARDKAASNVLKLLTNEGNLDLNGQHEENGGRAD